ncbi:MAG: molybdopterin molybdotransferase MoeA [Hyphomicrobiaceae bacterium]
MAHDSPGQPLKPVEEALALICTGVAPLEAESVPIEEALGRVLAAPLAARLTQPPFDASAMDGYAVKAADLTRIPARLRVIGESAAGHPFGGNVAAGEAVRIFTGAPVPAGADSVVIQEDTGREGETVVVREGGSAGQNIRKAGFDFRAGQPLIGAGRRLNARELSLAAAMGHGTLAVRRRPVVALVATGDELVPPGETPGPGQIVSSLPVGLAGMVRGAGGVALPLGIARDTLSSLDEHIARGASADILVTIGGASVGDHDLVHKALAARGLSLAFWRIAMRPGKPLMFGRLGDQRVLGLPGNPVSAMLCARVFLVPLINALLAPTADPAAARRIALAVDAEANGPRQHYVRAVVETDGAGARVRPLPSQDSSLVSGLARADVLIVRPPHAPAAAAGSMVDVLPLDF